MRSSGKKAFLELTEMWSFSKWKRRLTRTKKLPGVTTAPPILSSFPLGFFGKLFWRRDGEVREQMPCNFES
jgi:hypothetical protein